MKPCFHTTHSHKIYSRLTPTWHLCFPSSTLTAGIQLWIPIGGRVIHQTLPSLSFLSPPIQEGSGNQTSYHPCGVDVYTAIVVYFIYESFAIHLQLQFFLVSAKLCVLHSGRSITMLVFTASPTSSNVSCCFFWSALSRLMEIFSITPWSLRQHRGLAHEDQHTSHLQRKSQRRNSFTTVF